MNMILYNYEIDFELVNEDLFTDWVLNTIQTEGFETGEINYVFCDDAYQHKLNIEFLNHDTLTDIISFDYTQGKLISGDIFISIERVLDNAKDLGVSFEDELKRVMIHGVLHYCGYKDKSEEDALMMRSKEDEYMAKANF